ncbi:hypothetical protein SAMN05216223_1064 [Actinacidiphila yanglinensis]|uniref:Uncharacterized protein n=1 Tax=Actinacidiphila yanglinensis TaxID=310779 RepID=A0A1H6AUX6_9ACTN|nr:hypothetical protein [Actinacidiphila yanglinensis]SEG52483.1 hypothetical protein SAMN05216223_1064 [Actinacidiphila yanglinensis]
MRKSKDEENKARKAAQSDRRETERGAHEADETKDRNDERFIEEDDHAMESLKRDDRP